jgi:SAM-dependent methyltransferase
MKDWQEILDRTQRYYAGTVREHGATARGVDWNSEASQLLRFDQFARLLDPSGEIAITDYGCGYGALVDWLEARGGPYRYLGFDLSPEMIALAKARHAGNPACHFSTSEADLGATDYTLASGIFNVKLEATDADWTAYVYDVIHHMAGMSRRGFAFNMLTLDSDPEKRRRNLYYADPAAVFEHCRARYSRSTAVLQDYGLYEFTILVRKD